MVMFMVDLVGPSSNTKKKTLDVLGIMKKIIGMMTRKMKNENLYFILGASS